MVANETVGPTVGPVSVASTLAAAARYIRNGAMYDVALGGLPFVKAPSDEHPYARETAEFRKQQIDQSQTVGDQSLTGYWTRGQSSFHRGAGIKYYEILEGDTIPNRFTDSLNVDVWTPGVVTLKKSLNTISVASSVDCVQYTHALAVGVVSLSASGGLIHASAAGVSTALATSTAAAATSITTDGVNTYCTSGNRIERLTPAGSPTTFALLWTHATAGRTWSNVWWAKDRLWAVDNTGVWFTLSAVGGTTAVGDILWTSLKDGAGWSLAESQGGVFVARGNSVFLSTLDLSTPTPTLGVPAVVVSEAAQETISTIGSYLGYLIVCSDSGVRVGRISGTQVLLGPLVQKGDLSGCRHLGFRDSLVAFTGFGGDAPATAVSMWEANLVEQVEDLRPAYARIREYSSAVALRHGSLVLADGRVVVFSNTGILVEDPAVFAANGFVKTGLHRFGTLELKEFRTLTVRATGGVGTVAVTRFDPQGAGLSLVSLTADNLSVNDIPLRMPAPTDAVGLLFTLAPSAALTAAPVLTGYQLRALPAPKRQRLIQVPLLCFDVEHVGNREFGHQGWGWERLNALEALEEMSTVLTWQDFSIGETVSVSVEKIQYQNRTPSVGSDTGFGGYVVATLRKVD